MKRRKNTATSDDQLGLALTGEGFQGPGEAHGLLSSVSLGRHLRESEHFASTAETTSAYELVCRLVRENAAALRRRGEAFTCSALLEPILDALDWRRIPQQSMPGNMGTRKRPDYCLFTTDVAFAAAAQADAATLFRLSATVLEAKEWQHPLACQRARRPAGSQVSRFRTI